MLNLNKIYSTSEITSMVENHKYLRMAFSNYNKYADDRIRSSFLHFLKHASAEKKFDRFFYDELLPFLSAGISFVDVCCIIQRLVENTENFDILGIELYNIMMNALYLCLIVRGSYDVKSLYIGYIKFIINLSTFNKESDDKTYIDTYNNIVKSILLEYPELVNARTHFAYYGLLTNKDNSTIKNLEKLTNQDYITCAVDIIKRKRGN